MKALNWIKETGRFILLMVLYCILMIFGSMAVAEYIPDNTSDPGLVSPLTGLLIIAAANTALVVALIKNSVLKGLKLAVVLSVVYYGLNTALTQIETWYFLSEINVSENLLGGLFLMGIPTCFVFIPVAVAITHNKVGAERKSFDLSMPLSQWIWKLLFLILLYITFYWLAGYYIAWQNPGLRSFYRGSDEILPFWEHTLLTLKNDPGLFGLQFFRAFLWIGLAIPIIKASRWNAWWTAILVGAAFSVPQNIGHIIENPIIPDATVRMSHLIETSSSTFLFGMAVVWLLHRCHSSFKDLFDISSQQEKTPDSLPAQSNDQEMDDLFVNRSE
ncbi:MAG: hypothetical protein JJU28_07570 [Cyclobacteriaceae bacterium]|nr:hypothetical protein [Cyclobacteriaceae bacterium]